MMELLTPAQTIQYLAGSQNGLRFILTYNQPNGWVIRHECIPTAIARGDRTRPNIFRLMSQEDYIHDPQINRSDYNCCCGFCGRQPIVTPEV